MIDLIIQKPRMHLGQYLNIKKSEPWADGRHLTWTAKTR
jgi:hypothetical protein